ncbi:MAG: ELM1/GtrOC1 family putative glycosyltransferase [Sphingomicrobium sp.]
MSPKRVWALLGPHRGDNNQILALANALGLPFEEKHLRYNWLRRLPAGLLGATFASVAADYRKLVEGEPPDLTISTGLRSVSVVRELKRRSGGRMRAVHLGFPRISPRHFDLVVPTPEYPVPDAPNVLRIPFALTPHRERAIEQSDRDLLHAFPQPRRLFLVGGPTLYWGPVERMTAAVGHLLDAAQKHGGSVLMVGSPRTPVGLLDAIRQTLEASSVPFLFEPGDGPPAYPALIEAADAIFVTADSVAMVADAVMTGKPVGIVPIARSRLGRAVMAVMDRLRPGRRLYPRDLRFFWAALKQEGFGGTLAEPKASCPPDYAAQVAARVRLLLERPVPPATDGRGSDR